MRVFFLSCCLLFAINGASASKSIRIGSKVFSESIILAELVGVLLEDRYDVSVIRKTNLGGTLVVHQALLNGEIDVYAEYTGTGQVVILKNPPGTNAKEVYQQVSAGYLQRFGVVWSPPLGFNNTYALAVRTNDQRFKSIDTVTKLAKVAKDFHFAAPPEFMERPDGFPSFAKTYGITFGRTSVMNSGLTYRAVHDQEVDIIMAYSTDGRIKSQNLKLLQDDQSFFPPYEVALLAKTTTLDQNPELKEVFSLLAGKISESEMVELNNQVDFLKKTPRLVAKNFLFQKGLLNGEADFDPVRKTQLQQRLSKLPKLIGEHILLALVPLLLAVIIAIPIGITLARNPKLARYTFPVINVIQTIPSLALFGFLIPLVGIGKTPAFVALFLYSLLPLVSNTVEGIRGVDPRYLDASKGLGLTPFQILSKVEFPLALPFIMTGIRTAAVISIGTATLAALVGAGGLGGPILRGVSTVNNQLILIGAIPAALLAVATDKFLEYFGRSLISPGIRSKR